MQQKPQHYHDGQDRWASPGNLCSVTQFTAALQNVFCVHLTGRPTMQFQKHSEQLISRQHHRFLFPEKPHYTQSDYEPQNQKNANETIVTSERSAHCVLKYVKLAPRRLIWHRIVIFIYFYKS